MFDRCWLWRRQLSRRADGMLSPAQWGALENHLARCKRCQAAAEADMALRDSLQIHTGMLDRRSSRRLDDHVVAALFSGASVPEGGGVAGKDRPWSRRSGRAFPMLYLVQIMGGALAAAAVTALFLIPALHPALSASSGRHITGLTERAEPPVPLSSLLQSAAPRAALLWTLPQPAGARIILQQHAAHPDSGNVSLPPARPGATPRQKLRDLPNMLGS
jgi:anti-sigma factor RsiW